MAVGSQIQATDYNAIRAKIVSILGTGSGPRGYGQTPVSSDVVPGNDITKAQWDLLKTDLITIKYHQEGDTPSIVNIANGDVIRFGPAHPNTNYDTIAEQSILDKFTVAPSQTVLTARANRTLSTAWTSQAQTELTVTFATADKARYFFNSGSKIRFYSSRTGGTTSQQNSAWTNLLNTIANVDFGANVPVIENFYTLTDAYQTFYQLGSSSPYNDNYLRLEAKCDIADNSNGGATVLDFRITWKDDYTDPGPLGPPYTGDSIDGDLYLAISEVRAEGTSLDYPFSVDAPLSYSLNPITAS